MKKIVLLALAAVLAGCATMTTIYKTDLIPEKARVVEIIDCPNISKDRLFVLANSWAVDTFVSAESVIQFSDKEGGIIKGKYTISFSEGGFGIGLYVYDVRSTLTIEVKEGAARIIIADPYFRGKEWTSNYSYRPMESIATFDTNCLPRYRTLIASFKKAIQEASAAF